MYTYVIMGSILTKVGTCSFPTMAQRKMRSDFVVAAQERKFLTQAHNDMRKLILMKHLLTSDHYKWKMFCQGHYR